MSLSEMLLEDAEWWFAALTYANTLSLEVLDASIAARIDWRVDGESVSFASPKTTSWYLLFIREAISD